MTPCGAPEEARIGSPQAVRFWPRPILPSTAARSIRAALWESQEASAMTDPVPTDFARQLADAIIDMAESNGGLIRSKLEATIDAHVAIGGSDTFKKAAHVLAVLDAMRGVTPPHLDPRGWEKAVRS